MGPLIGGFIIMLYQLKLLLYFTCSIYILASIIAAFIKINGEAAGNKESFLGNARKGFRFMLENRVFGLLASIAFCWRLFLGLQVSLFVIHIKTCLAGTSEQYGIFITVMGIGSITGSLLGPYAAKRINTLRLIVFGLSLHYISFAALGLCRNYYWALAIIFSGYLIFYMTLVGIHAVRDQVTEFGIRGSAYGTVTAVLAPPAILSMLAGGYLANLFGAPTVLFGAGMLALLSLYLLLYLGRNINIMIKSNRENGVAKSG